MSASQNFLRDKKKGERDAMRKLAAGSVKDSALERMAREVLIAEQMLAKQTRSLASADGEEDDEEDGRENGEEGDEDGSGALSNISLESFDDCIDAAELCLTQGQAEAALAVAERALGFATTPEQVAAAHDSMGLALMEMPDRDSDAAAQFSLAEAQTPGSSYERCLNMAQMTEGLDSIRFSQMGLDLLEKLLNALPPARRGEDPEITEDREHYMLAASQTMTAMANLYLTDLCDEDNAESECERLLKEAVTTCPTNAEAFRSYSSLRMIQGKAEPSIKFILHAYKLLAKHAEERREPLEFMARLGIAEMLVKLEQWPEAAELVNALLDEDDKIGELWVHAGVAHANLALMLDEDAQRVEYQYAAAQYLISAQRLLVEAPDEELSAQIAEQLAQLTAAGVDLDVVAKTMADQEAAAGAATAAAIALASGAIEADDVAAPHGLSDVESDNDNDNEEEEEEEEEGGSARKGGQLMGE